MKYQLVLQWSLSEIDFDKLVEVEDLLVEELPKDCVDGHDFGSGEANIFLLTDDAISTWEKVRHILETNEVAGSMRSAYRLVTEDEYVILWPKTLSHFTVI
jgi:hypothetical protein